MAASRQALGIVERGNDAGETGRMNFANNNTGKVTWLTLVVVIVALLLIAPFIVRLITPMESKLPNTSLVTEDDDEAAGTPNTAPSLVTEDDDIEYGAVIAPDVPTDAEPIAIDGAAQPDSTSGERALTDEPK